MGGCCNTMARALLIIFNVIFWLSGAAILGVGVWFRVDKNINSYFDVIDVDTEDPYFAYATYVLIGFGAFVFLVGFCGCCGAIRESKCLLGFYIFFLILIIGGEIAAGVLAILYRSTVDEKVSSLLKDTIKKYPTSKTTRDAWDFVQIELSCCGAGSYEDWNGTSIKYGTDDVAFPASCCVLKDKDKAMEDISSAMPTNAGACFNQTTNFFHNKGCLDSLKDLISKYNTVIIGVGIGIAALEIIGIIFAVCVCREINGKD